MGCRSPRFPHTYPPVENSFLKRPPYEDGTVVASENTGHPIQQGVGIAGEVTIRLNSTRSGIPGILGPPKDWDLF